jgi:hypothetical protein
VAGASGGVGAMARLSGDALAAWVSASCTRHGVPFKVSDPGSVRDVVVLLSGRAEWRRGSDALGRPDSDSPGDVDSFGVQSSTGSGCGGDDDAVDDGFDDRGLSGEVQLGPLSA